MKIVRPGAKANCPQCQGLGIELRSKGRFLQAERCRCVTECPICQDDGWVQSPENHRLPLKRCRCQQWTLRERRLNAAKLPGRYEDATLRNLTPDAGNLGVMPQILRYSQSFTRDESQGFIVAGPVGTGKTWVIVALTRELIIRTGITARFIEFSHLLSDLKASFERGSGAAALMDELAEVDLLVIDELGKGRHTEFEDQVLDELVGRRYNAAKPILATTNYRTAGKPTGNARPELSRLNPEFPLLAERISPRVMSRLTEMCATYPWIGADRRRGMMKNHHSLGGRSR